MNSKTSSNTHKNSRRPKYPIWESDKDHIYTTFGGTKVKTCYQNFLSMESTSPPITTMANLLETTMINTVTNTLGGLTNTNPPPISIGRVSISIFTSLEGRVDATTTASIGDLPTTISSPFNSEMFKISAPYSTLQSTGLTPKCILRRSDRSCTKFSNGSLTDTNMVAF